MKEERRTTKTGSGRGTYARQACNHCRRRKSKCDGQQPVCGPCRDSGRADECTWGRETAKKARTQQHFESLVNHIKSLEARVKELEGERTGPRSHPTRSGSVSDAARSAGSSSLSPHPSPVTKFELDDDTIPNGDDGIGSASSDNDSEIEQLIAPTRHLVLTNGEVEVYGPTSAYRLAPELKSDGMEGSNPDSVVTNPSPVFDWSRHLPPEAPLTRAEHDRLLDLLFRFCTSWCFRVIPNLFFRDMQRALTLPPSAPVPRLSHYSPMLHNALLALATAYSDDPRVHDIEFRRVFARCAKSYIEKDCLTPSVCFVSALSLLSTFHSSRGEQSLGYLYAGMAGRMTQALGLQIDCSSLVKSGRIKEADMLNRNWAYWATFCQDVCWSLYIGRDCAMAPPKEGQGVPVPFADSEFDHEPWSWEPSGLPPQKSNIASVFAATCGLLRIGRRVMDFVNGLGTDFKHPNLQVVSELDIELNAWKDSLAPEVDLTAATRPSALPHRLTVHLMFWWLFILLHRPFYRRTRPGNVDIDHVKLCNRAAENMMLLLGIWHNNYNLRYVSTTHVQITFSAGTVFVLSAIQAISGPRLGRVTLASSLSHVETCLEYLAVIGRSWETAEIAREILLSFFDETLKPRLLLRGGDASLKFELQDVDKRARARANSSATSPVRQKTDDESGVTPTSPFGPALSMSSSGGPGASLHGELRYFPGSPTLPTLGWPSLASGGKACAEFFAPSSASPTLEHYARDADMDLDVGYSFGMNMNMVSDLPAQLARAGSTASPAGASCTAPPNPDMMAFGVPELGVGYGFDSHAHAHVALEFSAEELAIMDQIVRQQQQQHGGGAGSAPELYAIGQQVG